MVGIKQILKIKNKNEVVMNEQEKIKYRNICRKTHLMQCNKDGCSNPLGHSPFEYQVSEGQKSENWVIICERCDFQTEHSCKPLM